MNNEQSEKSIKCNLFIDHQLSWAGDGYFCENCRVRFRPVPNERSEESPCYCAEINFRNCPRHQNSEESAEWVDQFITPFMEADKIVRTNNWNDVRIGYWYHALAIEGLLQAERTRIIKALEGLKENHAHYEYTCLQFDPIIDQAIKAVEKGNI